LSATRVPFAGTSVNAAQLSTMLTDNDGRLRRALTTVEALLRSDPELRSAFDRFTLSTYHI
jgi:hypothetical protein